MNEQDMTPEQREVQEILLDTHLSMMTALGALEMDRRCIRDHISSLEISLRSNMDGPGCIEKKEALDHSIESFRCVVERMHRIGNSLMETCDELQCRHGGQVSSVDETSTDQPQPQL